MASESPTSAPQITVVEAIESEARRTLIVALGIVILTTLAIGTYIGVKQALRELRGAAVGALRDAQVSSIRMWLTQRVASAERWAGLEEVQFNSAELLRSAAAAPRAGCGPEASRRVVQALRPAMHERGFVRFNLVDRSGAVISSDRADECRLRWASALFLPRLARAFAGTPQFVRPHPEAERFGQPSTAASRREAAVWVLVPVTNAAGEVIAVLGMGERADQFAELFRPPGLGTTDEVYAFSPSGLMLSEPRAIERARDAGILVDRNLPGGGSNIELRDPGGDLLENYVVDTPHSAWPLTKLVAIALAAQREIDGPNQAGVLIEPYRNYRGVPVIGAWRWLPDLDFGVALEIERSEAYAPLRTLDRAFAIVLGLTVAAGIGVLISVLSAIRERRRFGTLHKLGRYTLVERIGEGGMASVYRGRHELLKRPIAVKILKRTATDEWIARFQREVQLASRLGHPNVVEIYDYGTTRSGDFYYVMEYLDGLTLGQLVARDGALPVERAVHLLCQMLAALKSAHQLGLVHRDIKPENVMVCARGGEHDVVKLVDFGLVKDIAEVATRDLTRSITRVLGTPAYMAPERFENPGAADPRTDLYSVGAVAYLLLTGRRLFDGFEGEDLQFQITSGTPPSPSKLRGAALPAALEAFVLQCLAKRPEERPASAGAALDELREIARAHPWIDSAAEAWWAAYAAERSAATRNSTNT